MGWFTPHKISNLAMKLVSTLLLVAMVAVDAKLGRGWMKGWKKNGKSLSDTPSSAPTLVLSDAPSSVPTWNETPAPTNADLPPDERFATIVPTNADLPPDERFSLQPTVIDVIIDPKDYRRMGSSAICLCHAETLECTDELTVTLCVLDTTIDKVTLSKEGVTVLELPVECEASKPCTLALPDNNDWDKIDTTHEQHASEEPVKRKGKGAQRVIIWATAFLLSVFIWPVAFLLYRHYGGVEFVPDEAED